MKKLLSLLLALLLVCSFGMAETTSPLGTWHLLELQVGSTVMNPVYFNMEMTMVLNEDGTGLLTMTEEEDQVISWTEEAGVIYATTIADGQTLAWQQADGLLIATMGEGIAYIMGREMPESEEAYIPAAAVSAADLSAFDGAWTGTYCYIADLDTTVPFSQLAPTLAGAMGIDMVDITISNGQVDLIPEQPGIAYFLGEFSEGTIIVRESADSAQIVTTLTLLEDGMLCMNINGIPLYYEPAVTSE